MKFGAYVRRAAKSSIRKAKSTSKPGRPPHSHVGTLKRLLYFGFDPATASVVVGPVPFAAGTAPRVLELGGEAPPHKNPRRRKRKIGSGGEIRLRGRKVVYTKLQTQAQVERAEAFQEQLYGPEVWPGSHIEPRPYMGPAPKQVLPQLPPLWANSVH